MAVHTGIVSSIVCSGETLSGDSGSAVEGTVIIGKERGKFNRVGTDISEITTGMKTVEGTLRRAWISGDALFQSLLDGADGGLTFEVTVQSVAGASITASGCKSGPITRRVAPGTEVTMEEMPFTGINWY